MFAGNTASNVMSEYAKQAYTQVFCKNVTQTATCGLEHHRLRKTLVNSKFCTFYTVFFKLFFMFLINVEEKHRPKVVAD